MTEEARFRDGLNESEFLPLKLNESKFCFFFFESWRKIPSRFPFCFTYWFPLRLVIAFSFFANPLSADTDKIKTNVFR